jgi:hypothetical protein
VLSARDLEREMLKSGQPIVPAAAKKSSPHSVRRKRTARHPAAPAPQPSRSAVSSRDGYVDRTDLMATMMSLPEVGVAPPESETQPQPVAPSWTPEEAITLINETDCPEELRRRLIEVVSDPAIRTSHYVWGAETPGQFDCSGLALYIYNGLDVKLPRVSTKQAEAGVPVERADLRAGDLVFFNTRGTNISHVGIYLGGGRFLHAANPRANLQITGLDSAYYARRYVTARRVYNPSFASGNTIRQGG